MKSRIKVILILLLSLIILRSDHISAKKENINTKNSSDKSLVMTLVNKIEKRKEELTKREEELNRKEKRLKMIKMSILKSLKEYKKIRDELKTLLESQNSKGGIKYIAKIYETIPADEAAQRIERLSEQMAVKLLLQMKRKQAARVIAAMNPEKAARLTEKMTRIER